MKIGFILNAALDKSNSAISLLAIELANLGHNVTLFSISPDTNKVTNVRQRNISISNRMLNLDSAILETDFAVLIVKNEAPEFALALKQSLPYKPKIFLWTDFDYNQPLNNGLYNTDIVTGLDGIVCVSEWQSIRLRSKLQIPKEKLYVQRYAISPIYENLFANAEAYIAAKTQAPSIAYTAQQTEGLNILLDLYPDISNNYPNSSLCIYSDLSAVTDLAKQANSIKGVKQTWPIWEKDLVTCLRPQTILAYPGIIEETSNIAITEAMAAGLYVVTSKAGALPEYCCGNGKQISENELRSDSLGSFIGQLLSICQTQVHSHEAFYDYCYKQILEINKKQTYRVRAGEWIDMLSKAITR